MIPLRPELVEFMLPESLGRLCSCSKTLRTDVRETNAWTLLAAVQCPPQKAPTSESRERDAISRVQSHLLRRRLAANLSLFAPNAPPPPALRDNFTDFTYFLRIEDNGTLIWEGDLAADTATFDDDDYDNSTWGSVRLVAPGSMRASICAVEGLATYLANGGLDEDGDEDFDDSYLNRIKLSMVAVREADSAMVSIGCFKLYEIKYDEDPFYHAYTFEAQHSVFSSSLSELWSNGTYTPFELKARVGLELSPGPTGAPPGSVIAVANPQGGPNIQVQLPPNGPAGRATVGALFLSLGLHVGEPNQHNDFDTLDRSLDRNQFQLMLTHLAGAQNVSREAALAAIQEQYAPPTQTLAASIREEQEMLRTWLGSGVLGSSTQFSDEFYNLIAPHAASREQLVSRPWFKVADLLQLETLPIMVQKDFKEAWRGLKLQVEGR